MSSTTAPSRWAETTDEILMSRYADGDAEAFEELFRRYERRAYAFFFKRTGSPERARDLYQELFLRIHRARDRYDPARPFKPWFFQIAHRLLVDDRRRAFRSHEVLVEDQDVAIQRPMAEWRTAGTEELVLALEALSPGERRVLVATRLEGAVYADVAAGLGKSVVAIRQMASRAMRRLREARDGPYSRGPRRAGRSRYSDGAGRGGPGR